MRHNAIHTSNARYRANVHAHCARFYQITSTARLGDSSVAHMLLEAAVTPRRCRVHSTAATATVDRKVVVG